MLDDDVAAKLKSLARRSGRTFRDVVNDALRAGLTSSAASRTRAPFTVKARDLGQLRPGVSLDDIAGLLDHVEGSLHR
jgi:plasmid stability protein